MLTNEEVNNLSVGDVIERTQQGGSFLTVGKRYDVKHGYLGLHVIDDDGDRYDVKHIRTNRQRWTLVKNKAEDFPFRIDNVSSYSHTQAIEVTVVTDRAGLDKLREIEEGVERRAKLEKLRQQREEIEAKIKELEGDD